MTPLKYFDHPLHGINNVHVYYECTMASPTKLLHRIHCAFYLLMKAFETAYLCFAVNFYCVALNIKIASHYNPKLQ